MSGSKVSLAGLRAAITAAGVMACGMAALAVTPPNPKDLTQGTWELNLEKSKFCPTNAQGEPARPPRGGGRVISDLGWGMVAVQQIGIGPGGERTGENRINYVLKYDGKKYPANVDRPSNEAIIWKLVSPSRVEFAHYSIDDKVTSEYVRTVSDDGQEMTQTTKYPQRECLDFQVFDRKPDGPRQLLAK